ncbi:MAG: GTP-binding protein [Roseburia sp.]|nr:GTP-binding protein [Roseburia sp.]
MTKIDVVSGFLGAGKTTLIKKLLSEALDGSKTVLIENEFGEIGIDGGFLKEAGIEIKEMNSGCICCSLVGDFGASLKEVITTYAPERILIEPSGVGKLSDVLKAVEDVAGELDVQVNSAVAVVDASKCKMYIKNFGEFFINQIAYAGTIILSRTDKVEQEKINACVEMLRQHNQKAVIITTPLSKLEGKAVLETIEGADRLEDMMQEMLEKVHEEHEHHEHGEECTCGCHEHHHEHEEHGHEHEEHGHEHHHEHEEHGHEHEEHGHEHHHEHGEHGHHHHHADEVFTSWGMETPNVYDREEIEAILSALDGGEYGAVLRAKGMVPAKDGTWIYYDYVPGEHEVRSGKPEVTGKICVIGSELKEEKLAELFRR